MSIVGQHEARRPQTEWGAEGVPHSRRVSDADETVFLLHHGDDGTRALSRPSVVDGMVKDRICTQMRKVMEKIGEGHKSRVLERRNGKIRKSWAAWKIWKNGVASRG